MEYNLWKVRIVSFSYSLLSLVAIALVGVLASSDFAALIKSSFGESVITGFLLMLVPELVKALRNALVVRKLGGLEDKKIFLI